MVEQLSPYQFDRDRVSVVGLDLILSGGGLEQDPDRLAVHPSAQVLGSQASTTPHPVQ